MSTRRFAGAGSTAWGSSRSWPVEGLCRQVGRSGLMQCVAPTQGRTRSSSPRASLATSAGSAMWARVIATMSSRPSLTARRAVASDVMRVAWKTGSPTLCRKAPARARKGASAEAMPGMQSTASLSSVSMRP